MSETIGTYTLAADEEITYRGYECAAWWQRRRLHAGTYPVRQYGTRYLVSIPATVVEGYFASLWGGVPISREPYNTKQDAGQLVTHTLDVYDFGVAQLIHDQGAACAWNFPGSSIKAHQFESKRWSEEARAHVPCIDIRYSIEHAEVA